MPPHDVALEGDSVIDISHESLIRQWGRLRTWVEEEAESRATYLRLVEAARLRRAGKAGLWGEPDLTYARQWQEREAPNATWAERYGSGFDDAGAFLRDSEAAHAAELEQERQRAEAERMAKERELEQAKALAEAQRQRADEQAAASIRQRRLIWGLAAFARAGAGCRRVRLVHALQQRGAAEREGQRWRCRGNWPRRPTTRSGEEAAARISFRCGCLSCRSHQRGETGASTGACQPNRNSAPSSRVIRVRCGASPSAPMARRSPPRATTRP